MKSEILPEPLEPTSHILSTAAAPGQSRSTSNSRTTTIGFSGSATVATILWPRLFLVFTSANPVMIAAAVAGSNFRNLETRRAVDGEKEGDALGSRNSDDG